MKIDEKTGAISIGSITLSPLTSKKDVSSFENLVDNPPYQSYRIEENSVVLILFFKAEKLEQIQITTSRKNVSSWADFLDDNAIKNAMIQQKRCNEKLLDELLPSGSRTFSWGNVMLIEDIRNFSSQVLIEFSENT